MKNSVVIKSSRSGMTVILDPQLPFEELLKDVGAKFGESARFWGSVRMTLTLAGRELTPEEELALVNVITGNSGIEVLCLLDQDQERTRRCEEAINAKLMEISALSGRFYRGTLKEGEGIVEENGVVVIGDVEKGAGIVSNGHVVVVGDLRGSVTAGASGNTEAVVAAAEMAPSALQIAGVAVPCSEKGRRLAKGPVIVSLKDGQPDIKSLHKGIFG